MGYDGMGRILVSGIDKVIFSPPKEEEMVRHHHIISCNTSSSHTYAQWTVETVYPVAQWSVGQAVSAAPTIDFTATVVIYIYIYVYIYIDRLESTVGHRCAPSLSCRTVCARSVYCVNELLIFSCELLNSLLHSRASIDSERHTTNVSKTAPAAIIDFPPGGLRGVQSTPPHCHGASLPSSPTEEGGRK